MDEHLPGIFTQKALLATQAAGPRYHKTVEPVWNLYGPWLRLMLQIGLPLLLLGTPAMFLFERGSTPRWLLSKLALGGWTLVLIAMALYFILQVLQEAFMNLPGT